MISKKKATAMILGLTMGISGTAMAAPNDDTDINARIAALEAQQQQLSKQLNALKKENAKLKRTEKVANSNKAAIKNLKDAQNRIQINGFGRLGWDNDNINGYINRNDFRRTYLDLEGKYKVNDRWNMNFQAETVQHYAKYVTAQLNDPHKYPAYHPKDRDHQYDNEHGTIQRVWAEGSVGKVNLDIGRRWRGMGYNFAFFGNESDGVVADVKLPKSPLTAEAFYLTPTDRGYDFSVAGLGLKGRISPKLETRLAYGKLNVGKNEDLGVDYYGKEAAPWDGLKNSIGSHAFLIGAMYNPIKNIFLLGDYVHTNRERKIADAEGGRKIAFDGRDTYAVQMNYRWPDLNSPGSFQLYTRYFNYPNNENDLVGIFGDKQDGAFHAGNRGWVFGFKYVPAKNIEWDTFYMKANATKLVWDGHRGEQYHHTMLRTRVDFHF
ncbi:hypothetical protein [Selenomonas ruminis]|uniref:Porin n=1 Tax=Selenomonas ruminis TaxID=2593411 RepID=A0A5D6W786_9FIRM|nr:hypothetical protein [Selenomonas sp. mPRGC5]TYZ23857.1 hypothetical protein FZ040_03765 [Selenomonas sp. mPRGC5]